MGDEGVEMVKGGVREFGNGRRVSACVVKVDMEGLVVSKGAGREVHGVKWICILAIST